MRMRQVPEGREVRYDGRAAPRTQISAISEPSAGRDEQLGQIFLNMRLALRVPRETIARRLATTVAAIDNFEAGAVTALPHWKETQRIVYAYCELLRMDPDPILWRVRSHLQALASQAATRKTVPPAPPRPAARTPRALTSRTETSRARPERRRRRARALFALTAPVALLAGLVYLAQIAPRPVYRVIAWLPDRVEVPVRAGLDYVLLLTASRRDGLRWIDVGDPQSRKADKLPTAQR